MRRRTSRERTRRSGGYAGHSDAGADASTAMASVATSSAATPSAALLSDRQQGRQRVPGPAPAPLRPCRHGRPRSPRRQCAEYRGTDPAECHRCFQPTIVMSTAERTMWCSLPRPRTTPTSYAGVSWKFRQGVLDRQFQRTQINLEIRTGATTIDARVDRNIVVSSTGMASALVLAPAMRRN